METLTLSPAELELIRIKREEARLAEEKKQAERAKNHEKKIADMQKEIEGFKKANSEKNTLITKSFKTLNEKYPGLYQVKTSINTQKFDCKDYYTDAEREEKGIKESYAQFIVAEENVTYPYSIIERINSKVSIVAKHHTVRDSSSRYSFKSYTEVRLFIVGLGYDEERKALKNVLTAHKNIQETIDNDNRQKKKDDKEAIGWDMLLVECKNKHANDNAVIEKKDHYHSYSVGHNRREGYTIRLVQVTFPNGLVVQYSFRYYEENNNMVFKKDIYKVDYSKLDQTKMIEVLKGL